MGSVDEVAVVDGQFLKQSPAAAVQTISKCVWKSFCYLSTAIAFHIAYISWSSQASALTYSFFSADVIVFIRTIY